jgi:hypothetical protein
MIAINAAPSQPKALNVSDSITGPRRLVGIMPQFLKLTWSRSAHQTLTCVK